MRHRSSLSSSLCWLVLAAALAGADCRSNDKPTAPTTPEKTEKPATPGDAPPNEGLTEAETNKLLPGIDTGGLTPKQRQDLVDLSRDTFCPCSAETVAACIRKGPGTCRAATRLMTLAKNLIGSGMPEAKTLLYVEGYYGSFDHREDIPAGDSPSKGAPAAKVVIEEFSDFQCPVCRAAHPNLGELLKKYPNDVKWYFKFFPLPQHEHAAKAALCASYAYAHGGNDKFWKMVDHFFAHQDQLGEDEFKAAAAEAGVNATEMFAAIDKAGNKYADRVEADKKLGNDVKIQGTPSVFINGRPLVLPATLEMLSWAVEDELEWMANGKKWNK